MLRQFAEDFKAFAVKGNAIDMAIGIVIGAAFNKIVNSIVTDLMMPPLGLLIGGVDFKNLQFVLKPATVDAAGNPVDAVAIRYGLFINTCIDFLIVAFTVFMMVRLVNRLSRLRVTLAT